MQLPEFDNSLLGSVKDSLAKEAVNQVIGGLVQKPIEEAINGTTEAVQDATEAIQSTTEAIQSTTGALQDATAYSKETTCYQKHFLAYAAFVASLSLMAGGYIGIHKGDWGMFQNTASGVVGSALTLLDPAAARRNRS